MKVVELGGIGPAPFGGMLLADMGADVVRVDRPGASVDYPEVLNRGKRSVAVDLKHPDGVGVVLRLVEGADALIEGFRPGVAERLRLGPDECLERNPRLVYARMTGWGQRGPLAAAAGHDINYIALSGALSTIGRKGEAPVPPVNLLGDFGGGGMLLGFGVMCALHEAGESGRGQVVDAAMVDGASLLTAPLHGVIAAGQWYERGTNGLDTGAHFYEVYECADGEYVSVGSIEPQFYAELRRLLGLDEPDWDAHLEREAWPALKERLAVLFRTRTRAEWCNLLEGTDVCFAPVLSLVEARDHPHIRARETYIECDGVNQPAPAPRFSRTPGAIPRRPPAAGEDTDEVLAEIGFPVEAIAALRSSAAVS